MNLLKSPHASPHILKWVPKLLAAAIVMSPLISSTTSFAQQGNSDTTGIDGTNIQHSGGKRIRIGDTSTADNTLIRGRCVMVKTADNPIGGYCANVALVLYNESGKSIGQLRTDLKGYFEINVDAPDAKYHFGPSSSSYEVDGSNKPVQGGGHTLIKLKLKAN
jgi:hypothetical protein